MNNQVTVADELAFAALPDDIRAIADKMVESRLRAVYDDGYSDGRRAGREDGYDDGWTAAKFDTAHQEQKGPTTKGPDA